MSSPQSIHDDADPGLAARVKLLASARDPEERERLLTAMILGRPLKDDALPFSTVVIMLVLSFLLGIGYSESDRYSYKAQALNAAVAACADIAPCVKLASRYAGGNDVKQYLPSPGY